MKLITFLFVFGISNSFNNLFSNIGALSGSTFIIVFKLLSLKPSLQINSVALVGLKFSELLISNSPFLIASYFSNSSNNVFPY